MPLAVVTTILAVTFGIYLSFWIDSAPAPTVIMVLTICFICTLTQKIHLSKATFSTVKLASHSKTKHTSEETLIKRDHWGVTPGQFPTFEHKIGIYQKFERYRFPFQLNEKTTTGPIGVNSIGISEPKSFAISEGKSWSYLCSFDFNLCINRRPSTLSLNQHSKFCCSYLHNLRCFFKDGSAFVLW